MPLSPRLRPCGPPRTGERPASVPETTGAQWRSDSATMSAADAAPRADMSEVAPAAPDSDLPPGMLRTPSEVRAFEDVERQAAVETEREEVRQPRDANGAAAEFPLRRTPTCSRRRAAPLPPTRRTPRGCC